MLFIGMLWIIIILCIGINGYLLISSIYHKRDEESVVSKERYDYEHDLHSLDYELSKEQARTSARIGNGGHLF